MDMTIQRIIDTLGLEPLPAEGRMRISTHSPFHRDWTGMNALVAGFALTVSSISTMQAQVLVSFPTPDGGIVYAHEYGGGSHGVVLAHGGRFTKESWGVQALALEAEGFRVLAIDFRGRGRSRGPDSASGEPRYEFDVLGAVRYLRATGAADVSVVGASFGGWAAAQASVEGEPGQIDRLVLLAHSPIAEPERMHGRKLFITSRDDFSGDGVLRLPDIRDQYRRAPGPKELVILEGDTHAQFLFDTNQGDRLLNEIVRFLSEP
jgi:pimeloyl-ACP methyl ester carboxylesterase